MHVFKTTGFKSALGSLKTYLASPREPAIYFLEVRQNLKVPEVIETHTTYRFTSLLSHQFPLDRDATARVEETGEIYIQSHQWSVTLGLVNVFSTG